MLVDLYFGRGRTERYTVSKFDVFSEDAPCDRYCLVIRKALAALCTNALGDSGDLNEWLLPHMQEHGIKSITIHYLEDYVHTCTITPTNQEELATGLHFDSQFLTVNSLADLKSITHEGSANKLVFIECSSEIIQACNQSLAATFKEDAHIFFFFNVFGKSHSHAVQETTYFSTGG